MEDMLVKHPRMDTDMMKKMNRKSSTETFDAYSETEMSEFESIKSLRNLPIDVSDGLIERCATQLSQNDMVVGRQRTRHARIETMGTVRRLAIDKSQWVSLLSNHSPTSPKIDAFTGILWKFASNVRKYVIVMEVFFSLCRSWVSIDKLSVKRE